MNRKRCAWAEVSDLDREYHDNEWAIPIYDERKLFECLTLEGAQAGLSWSTILKKEKVIDYCLIILILKKSVNMIKRK